MRLRLQRSWTTNFPRSWIPTCIVQEMLISYFYKGLQPEHLREKISHFKVSNIKEVFNVFREYCTPIMVEATNLSFLDTRQKKEVPQIRQFPRQLNHHSSESPHAAKKASSLQSEHARIFSPVLSGDLPIFDRANCEGTHKSMNCTKPCRLYKSKGNNTEHVQYLCPLISNAKERKQNQ